jgi:hypothetical protein
MSSGSPFGSEVSTGEFSCVEPEPCE